MSQIDFSSFYEKYMKSPLVDNGKRLNSHLNEIIAAYNAPELRGSYENYNGLLVDIDNQRDRIQREVEPNEIKIVILGSETVGKRTISNCLFACEFFPLSAKQSSKSFTKVKIGEKLRIKCKDTDEMPDDIKQMKQKINMVEELITNGNKVLESEEYLEIYLEHLEENSCFNRDTVLVKTPAYTKDEKLTERLKNELENCNISIVMFSNNFAEEDKEMLISQLQNLRNSEVFILINKWDITDSNEQESTKLSRTSLETNIISHVKTGGHLEEDEVKRKIFFISAEEMLRVKLNKLGLENMTETQKERHESFSKLENLIKESIQNENEKKSCQYLEQLKEIMNKYSETIDKIKQDIGRFKEPESYEKLIKNMDGFQTNLQSYIDKNEICMTKEFRKDMDKCQSDGDILISISDVKLRMATFVEDYFSECSRFILVFGNFVPHIVDDLKTDKELLSISREIMEESVKDGEVVTSMLVSYSHGDPKVEDVKIKNSSMRESLISNEELYIASAVQKVKNHFKKWFNLVSAKKQSNVTNEYWNAVDKLIRTIDDYLN